LAEAGLLAGRGRLGDAARDRGPAGEGLQAADLTAATGRPVRADLDVADLAGDVGRAAVDPVVEDQPAADAGPDEDAEHVAAPAAGPVAVLGDHGRAHVVLEPDRQ